MSDSDQRQLLSSKQFLINNNPIKLIKNDPSLDIELLFNGFINHFNIIFGKFKSNEFGTDDKTRLLLIDSFSIWILRSTQLLNNKKFGAHLGKLKIIIKSQLLTIENCNFIFDYIIDFWNDSSNAIVNALRDLFTKLLHLLKIIYDNNEIHHLLFQWMDQILEISSSLRVQYYLVETLSLENDMFHILERKPNFIRDSLKLMSNESLSNPIGKCLVNLLVNIYNFHFSKDISKVDEWFELWKDIAIHYLHDLHYTKSVKLYLLTPLFKHMPSEVFVDFVQHTKLIKEDPSIILSLLKIGQELGIDEEPFHMDRLISREMLESLLNIDEYKLPAFELLTYSKKKSREIHHYIFEIIKRHFKIFFVDTNIQTKNYFESALKSFILRVRDSAYSLDRDIKKLMKADKFPDEQNIKKELLLEYKGFMLWLFTFLKNEIIPGTQFHRSTMSLNIISIIIDSGLDIHVDAKDVDSQNKRYWPFNIKILDDSILIRLLLDNLISNFSDVRKISKNILFVAFGSNDVSKDMISTMINKETLATKAIESMNAYQNTEAGATIEMFLFGISPNKLQVINTQLKQLGNEIKETKLDPISNATNNISGYFTSLAMFFESFEFNTIEKITLQKTLDNVWEQVINSWDVVKILMCHDSSEGLLPKEYLESHISDQVITSYAFRTVKEMSRLIDVILRRFPLAKVYLHDIGDLLISQLFSIRHSGAFQAVLPTFRTCCIQCRKVSPTQLTIWLDSILESLEVRTQHITRRSGGLPFLITNILSTETDKERPELKNVFDKLLNIIVSAPDIKHQDKLDIPQVNAFNCIKAIFVEAKLANACTPYFPQALEFSLKYFTSEIWAMRNCSLMLFTSLQNRIFGKSGKSISGRLFFSKFPAVQDILLNILKTSIKQEDNVNTSTGNRNIESIFLVLNILMCLKQTPGYDGLTPFIIEIFKCLENRNWKVRDMAARTIASLADDTHMELVPLLKNTTTSNQNELHGHLLALKYLFTNDNDHALGLRQSLVDKILVKAREFITFNGSYTTIKAYIEVVDILLVKFKEGISQEQRNDIVCAIGNFFIENNTLGYINGSKQLCVSHSLLFLLSFETETNKTTLCQLGLESPLYEVQGIALQHIQQYLHNMSEDDIQLVKNRLEFMLYDENTLVTLKPLIIPVLRFCDGALSFSILIDTINKSNSEAVKLSAIEYLGEYVTNESDVELMWGAVEPYLRDDVSEVFRSATLNCLTNCSKNVKSNRVLFQLFKMLDDDDIEIRERCATILDSKFMDLASLKLTESPIVVSEKFSNIYVDRLDKPKEVASICTENIKNFFNDYNIFANKEHFEGLFDREKENQYRNDIEQNIQFIEMIEKTKIVPTQLKSFALTNAERLNKYLTGNNIQDEPLGWMHSMDVISRVIVLRFLIKHFTDVSHLTDFDKMLEERHAHPLITEYQYL